MRSNEELLHDVKCKGSWNLGTACGWCVKCRNDVLQVVADLVDPEPCRYHGGICQTHPLSQFVPIQCRHERAKRMLTTAKHCHGFKENPE